MSRFAAFLRGVNLGGRTVEGPQLVSAFSSLGLDHVNTFLASGNVVFDTAPKAIKTLQTEIEMRLEKELGFETRTFVRAMDRIKEIVQSKPFGFSAKQCEEFTIHAIFLEGKTPKKMQQRLSKLRSDYDDFAFDGNEAFWLCRGPKISDSQLFKGNKIEKAIAAPNTMRNLRTLQRLIAKFGTE